MTHALAAAPTPRVTQDRSTPRSDARILAIDGLRAVAIVLVMLRHLVELPPTQGRRCRTLHLPSTVEG